jgi:hypothetical protein
VDPGGGEILVLAILAVRERFFFGGLVGWGGLIVSFDLTLFKFISPDFAVALSLSVVGGAERVCPLCGLLVTSTVILLCPSKGCTTGTGPAGVTGLRCGEVGGGGNIIEDELDVIFFASALSWSDVSPVSSTSEMASRDLLPAILLTAGGGEGEGEEGWVVGWEGGSGSETGESAGRTGVEGRMLRMGGGETTRARAGGGEVCVGEKTLGTGWRGGGERTRGPGGEKTRSRPRTGEGEVGRGEVAMAWEGRRAESYRRLRAGLLRECAHCCSMSGWVVIDNAQ